MHFTQALLRGIADTLSWRVIKSSLITGIPLALLWLGIGYLLWQPVTGVTATVIGWVPFSILKANGAFLLAGFVWFAAVLVTFALIVGLFHVPIMKFVPEEKFEHFAMLLLLVISLAWTLFIFLDWDFVYGEVLKVLAWFPFQTLQDAVALMLGILFFYNLFIVSLALVVLLYHKPFLHALQKDDYPDATLAQEYKGRHFLPIALRDTVIFLILIALFFPLFFVPFINIIIQVFFWAWLIKDSYFLAAASLYASDEEIKELKKHQFVLWGIAFVTSLLNILPIVNILAPFFALIVFFHWTMLNRPHLPVSVPTPEPEAAE